VGSEKIAVRELLQIPVIAKPGEPQIPVIALPGLTQPLIAQKALLQELVLARQG
jgi:hypothetical protein